MPRRALTIAQVKGLTANGTHLVAPQLYLQIKPNGARSWLYRYAVNGKARWHGLGSERDVPLADARQRAEELRVDIRRHGLDPVAERKAKREVAASAKALTVPTFKTMGEEYVEAHEAGWRNEKHRAQWRSTLATYCYPKLGALTVDKIDVDDVLAVLKPIWTKKPETAGRVRGRIEKVLGYAKAKGHRTGDNPAAWRDALQHLLPALSSVQKIESRKAMAYAEAPAFYEQLLPAETVGAKALRLLMLTMTRTQEVLGARWEEFDLDERVWTIPAERMKAGRVHRVPLPDAAVELLRSLSPKRSGLVFPGAVKGKTLSNATMMKVLRTKRPDLKLDVHGFRSTARDWAAEQTDHPSEIAEMALAHQVGSEVERAYRKSDLLEKRRALGDDWARFLTGPAA